jgi:hypothetical protein
MDAETQAIVDTTFERILADPGMRASIETSFAEALQMKSDLDAMQKQIAIVRTELARSTSIGGNVNMENSLRKKRDDLVNKVDTLARELEVAVEFLKDAGLTERLIEAGLIPAPAPKKKSILARLFNQ